MLFSFAYSTVCIIACTVFFYCFEVYIPYIPAIYKCGSNETDHQNQVVAENNMQHQLHLVRLYTCTSAAHADDVMAETASLRHIFVIQLFTLAAAVRPPSEARGAEAWDRAQTALRQVRMYNTMLSGYCMLRTTSHTLGLLLCASVDGRDMRSSAPQKASKML